MAPIAACFPFEVEVGCGGFPRDACRFPLFFVPFFLYFPNASKSRRTAARCRSTYVGTKQVIFICRSADSHGFYYLACHYESSKMMLSFSHHALVPLLEVTGAATRTFSNRPRKRLAAQRFSLGINGSKRGLLEETCARRWLGP